MPSLYQVLGVKRTATADEIKTAYRRKAKRLHPDHGGDEEKFKQLAAAYKALSDPVRRAQYDATPLTPRARARTATKAPFNPHPGGPPPTQEEFAAMAAGLRAVGLSLAFELIAGLSPDLGQSATVRQMRKTADRASRTFFDGLLRNSQ